MAHAMPTASVLPPQVMLLSVWLDANAAWHARVVLPDAQLHEFTNPFDLVQFLGQAQRAPPRATAKGLR